MRVLTWCDWLCATECVDLCSLSDCRWLPMSAHCLSQLLAFFLLWGFDRGSNFSCIKWKQLRWRRWPKQWVLHIYLVALFNIIAIRQQTNERAIILYCYNIFILIWWLCSRCFVTHNVSVSSHLLLVSLLLRARRLRHFLFPSFLRMCYFISIYMQTNRFRIATIHNTYTHARLRPEIHQREFDQVHKSRLIVMIYLGLGFSTGLDLHLYLIYLRIGSALIWRLE